ncbi:response regulator [[Clostridium] sordellii]|uniref:LytTR family DNA-binding domain-containing protein n=1 Tax=Paraclostridium sordellii TaxID=1505 RepID=UPI0005E74300|nr:LytTR family DNA-binding domain-containing protein [Paeniclostridium sordellii]CEN75089.1 response regulator [[Clostridium] sordellii] [Paeniclostridium sordellii]
MKIEVNVDESLDDIIVKINTPRMNDEINTIISKLSDSSNVLTGIRDEKTYLIDENRIQVIYSENKKVYASTEDMNFKLNYRLYELENILDKTKFIRVSNSAIVNIYQVDNFEANINGMVTIHLKNGLKEYISRRYLKKVKEFIS